MFVNIKDVLTQLLLILLFPLSNIKRVTKLVGGRNAFYSGAFTQKYVCNSFPCRLNYKLYFFINTSHVLRMYKNE